MPRALVSKLIPAAVLLTGLAAAAGLAHAQTTTYTEVKSNNTLMVDLGQAALLRMVVHPGNGPEALVNGPVWSQTPTVRDVADAFPALASTDSGMVVIRCAVSNIGSLMSCHTRSESPRNQGFSGAAYRKLISKFRLVLPAEQSLLLNTLVVDVPFQFTRPGTPATVMTKVDWRATPTHDQVTSALRQAGITPDGARATISCTVGAAGDLAACRTRDESRPGIGAALSSISSQFKVGLWSEEGRPTAGYRISVPLSVG